ncbi:MAG: HesA/MoeB/ThiF family protein [Proteobacteria bacterium]|nr:HesA/MoeB/ThiF family protein [Pseudomonadota bacterium]
MGRHARHIALAQIGTDGQQKISDASVLLIGVGGIGCAAASYLVSSGVGHVALNDFDTVDETNLGRQVLFGPDDLNQSKADVAVRKLAALNPDIRVTSIRDRLDAAAMAQAVEEVDVVLDGSDNFATRFLVNDACVSVGRCLISGAAIRLEGQLAVFGPKYDTSPCYRCLYEEADESLENCAGNGVLAAVPGVIGTLMAVEALKYLAGIDSTRGALQLYDAGNGRFQSVNIAKRDDCPGCGS